MSTSEPRSGRDAPPRDRGRRTRGLILEQAAALFAARGYDGVGVAEIAAAAGAHANQITYYFGSKDALFVHTAFRLLLRDAARLEPVGRRQRTPEAFRTAMARTALALPAVPTAVRAMSITRQRPELRPLAEQSLTLLFGKAQRYLTTILERRGWEIDRPADVETRTFWSAVLGARLISESGFGGRSDEIDLAGVLTVRGKAGAYDAERDRH
ncbi:TetR/AcrR family transcriptional regulator C-terminal domain-containing protein [Micromonospora sp. NBC_01796]|uniref:TetR/AcrR family transcriptional regulator C-terminal domain-containing protein n=1 Tax=Micromonospora sp. NBC_01796 TaxID=2975987 RepID=UPI002DDBE205|nr:TetR/AcrR family transcriptional regulator C-terminal domain-containing protein [Micromonospora sp. NBC_01796]WSA84526.1 TetR family transcriptional regulator [Micromonospora sp. NBC_01796]